MSKLKLIFICFVVSVFHLSAYELGDLPSIDSIDLNDTIAKTTYRKSKRKLDRKPVRDTKKPYWVPMSAMQNRGSVFFQTNIGLGLLYFYKPRGDLGSTPPLGFGHSVPVKRGMIYNRTPLFEYIIGYRLFNSLKLGISYQNQTGVVFQTNMLPYVLDTSPTRPTYNQFKSNLSLNAIQLKIFVEPPYSVIWRKILFAPFFALGVGPGWQSWFPTSVTMRENPFVTGNIMGNGQMIPNLTFMLDKGFRIQPAVNNASYSLLLGFKYMFWGQARNLGKLEKQGPLVEGYAKPFRIKAVYSFAPYLGFQWNFPATQDAYAKLKKIPGTEIDQVFIAQKYISTPPSLVTQFNAGPNFLYFSGIKGNLAPKPIPIFDSAGRTTPLNKRFNYNKAPLYEYLIGYQYNSWVQAGLSIQSQTNITVQTPWIASYLTQFTTLPLVKFRSTLHLTSVMAKAYFYMPYSIRAGFTSFNFFAGFGLGPSWQTWTNLKLFSRELLAGQTTPENNLYLRSKTVANTSFMIDLGFNMKNNSPQSLFMVTMGCRYNLWGQVRKLGYIHDQDGLGKGLSHPIGVKTLYSFAPYLGFQWNFPTSTIGNLRTESIDSWAPFIAPTADFEKQNALLVSMNMGPGCLRFAKVRGSIGGLPASSGNYERTGASQLKGRLRRNASLLFEYLLGYQYRPWLKFFYSLQIQEGIFVSSKPLPGASATNQGPTNQFNANLALYSLMAKVYLETPTAVVMRSVASTMYLAMGVGPGWQSWSSIEMFRNTNDLNGANNIGLAQSIRPKTCQNLTWMWDLGVRMTNATPNFKGSITFGIKYNQWGQARNLGAIDQSWNTLRTGLFKPVRIRTVYSWTPYLGFQWSF